MPYHKKNNTKKYLTKKLRLETLEATNKCFDLAVEERSLIYYNNDLNMPKDLFIKNVKYLHHMTKSNFMLHRISVYMDVIDFQSYITEDQFKTLSISIDEQYISNLLKLSSSILENIILIHNKGSLVRTQSVINVISNELFRRALLNDSNEKP